MGCIVPITIQNPNAPGTVAVPCGRCPGCRDARAASWAFRLLEEEKCHQLSLFVTLTYDDDHLPGSDFGLPTLDKKHVQLFFKRLRKLKAKNAVVKYYACGEYGSQTVRPHYHAIVFGATQLEIERAWALDGVPLGNCHFGEANIKTMHYVTKYMCKPRVIGLTEDDDRQREFSLMSKGLGASYLSPEVVKYHNDGLFPS